MADENQTLEQPATPPDIRRRLQFHRLQLFGMPFVLLIPVLALSGLFGEGSRTVSASNDVLEIRIEHPVRMRYKMIHTVDISLRNISPDSLPVVSVRFDRSYVDGFSTMQFSPEVKSIDDSIYIVEVADLAPNETRVVSVELQAETYWRWSGDITVLPDGAGSVGLHVHTFIFP